MPTADRILMRVLTALPATSEEGLYLSPVLILMTPRDLELKSHRHDRESPWRR